MKKSIVGIICLSIVLSVLFSGVQPVSAVSSYFEYSGTEKVTEYNALSSFTVDDINYRVTENPSGGKNGKVYVSGCKFKTETLNIPALVKKNGRKYDVVGINDMAFINFENLTKVTIEDGPTYIGGGAFWGCWYMKSIRLPKTLKELGESAFGYCGSLGEITFPDSVTLIPNGVCKNSGVSKVTFGKKTASIDSSAFADCLKLKEITLPESIKSIDTYAFTGCYNLAKITNKSKLTTDDLGNSFKYTKWAADRAKPAYEHYSADRDMPLTISLDNKQYNRGCLFYRMSDFERETRGLSYDDWDHGYYRELKKDSDGNFILEKDLVTDTYYPVMGELYYCENKPKDYLKEYAFKFGTSDIPSYSALSQEMYEADTVKAEKIRSEQGEEAYQDFCSGRKSSWDYYNELLGTPVGVSLYSVHFESGDVECRYLPEDKTVSKYSYAKLGDGNEELFLSYYGRINHPMAAGRAFAYYADSKGNRIDSVFGITEPLTVHPVFVDEEELFTGKDYVSEQDFYYTWYKRDSNDWQVVRDNVKIKSGKEFIDRLTTEVSVKGGLSIVDKKITLSLKELKKYTSGLNKEEREQLGIYTDFGRIYNKEEFLIVKDGGTLVLDGVSLGYDVRISLQKGATLRLINGAEISGILGVQKGAQVEICDGTFTGPIMNEGTITIETPQKKTSTDSFYKKSIRSNIFLNCKSGVINLDYGVLAWGNDFDQKAEPGFVRSDMRTEKDAVCINNGTVNVTGYGHISVTDSYQNNEHKESYGKTPVVNNGKINITASSKKFFEFSAFKIDHNSFYNHGTIKVVSDAKRGSYKAGSYAESCLKYSDTLYADVQILESEFINYGTVDINVKNGLGIAVTGCFFPPERVIKRFEDDGETASYGRLENRKGGKLKIVTDNGCGVGIGKSSCLINKGTVSIKTKGKKEPAVLIMGKLKNSGKITGKNNIVNK